MCRRRRSALTYVPLRQSALEHGVDRWDRSGPGPPACSNVGSTDRRGLDGASNIRSSGRRWHVHCGRGTRLASAGVEQTLRDGLMCGSTAPRPHRPFRGSGAVGCGRGRIREARGGRRRGHHPAGPAADERVQPAGAGGAEGLRRGGHPARRRARRGRATAARRCSPRAPTSRRWPACRTPTWRRWPGGSRPASARCPRSRSRRWPRSPATRWAAAWRWRWAATAGSARDNAKLGPAGDPARGDPGRRRHPADGPADRRRRGPRT